MAYPATTLGTDSTGNDYYGQTYRRGLVITVLEKKIAKEQLDQTFFGDMIGDEKSLAPVVKKTQLTKEPGDTIRLPLIPALTGAGVAGDIELVGSEQIMDKAKVDIVVNQLRSGVIAHGKMSEQRSFVKTVTTAKPVLQDWLTQRKEQDFFDTCYYGWPMHILGTAATYGALGMNSSVPRPPRFWYCSDSANNGITYSSTDATYRAAIKSAEDLLGNNVEDYFSPLHVEFMRSFAVKNNIPRANFKGMSGYCLFLHPNQTYQLRRNATWWAAVSQAGERNSKDNPIFSGPKSGYIGTWSGVHMFESNKVGVASYAGLMGADLTSTNPMNATANSSIYRALFLGAQAIAYGIARQPYMETEERDYKNKEGVGIGEVYGMGRTDYVLDASAATLYAKNIIVVSTYSPDATTTA